MRDLLFYLYVIIFIPMWVLFGIGVMNLLIAEIHKTEMGKREYSPINRILTGEGYNYEGMKYRKVAIRYFKRAGIGIAFLFLTFLLLVYVEK